MQSRRTFVKIVLAAGAVAGAGVLLPRYLKRARRAPGSSVQALFGDLRAGSQVDRWTLVEIVDVHAGVIPVLMASADGTRFQVDIAQRDPEGPKPVAETKQLALYLVNGGTGTTQTIEDHGLGVMALGAALRRREDSGAVAPQLVKLRERRKLFPEGHYHVFG